MPRLSVPVDERRTGKAYYMQTAFAAVQVSHWDALSGLSLALDMSMGRRPGHAQAVAALGNIVAERLHLPEQERKDLAVAALLKDSG